MRVKVELEIEVTGEATTDEVKEFLKYQFGYTGSCPCANPFLWEEKADYSVENFDIEEL